MTEPASSNESKQRSGQLAIQKVYLKDLSYEAPSTPGVFREEWKPTLEIELGTKASALGTDNYETVLSVTVTVRSGDKTAFLVEVQQAGVFHITGFPEQAMPAILATACPNILFPFVREVVSDVVSKAGFPQLLLAPVNFEALYAQELQRKQAEAAAPADSTAH
jgi:preprotein translocase subunit SecB